MEDLLRRVLEGIRPRKEDRERLRGVAEELMVRAEKVASGLDAPVRPMLVGSAARDTWLREERDIDIFLLFPEDTSRKELEEVGLAIARKVTEGKGREQFAEHPYLTAEVGGFDVDVVPCYDVEDPRRIRSAVDRSPYHQEYVVRELSPASIDQVLLLKKFLKGIGAYGSELKVHGFSGYLCELLIIRFGSFREVIREASRWTSEVVIDPSGEYDSEKDARRLFPDEPLIFVDPVDPGRNVAAAVSKRNLATFVRACQDFERQPSEKFFFPRTPSISPQEMRGIIEARGSKLLGVTFDVPKDLVPDTIYPQLRKTERTLVERIEGAGFKVLRSDVLSKAGRSLILLELSVYELPKVRRHVGPPLGVDSERFIEKHLSSGRSLAGPFIDRSGRLVFEVEREHTRAIGVLQDALEDRGGFGRHVAESVEEGYEIVEDEGLVDLAEDEELFQFLGDYLTRCLPWHL